MLRRSVPKLTGEIARSLLNRVSHVLFDCDGTLWAGDTPFAGATELIKYLHSANKRVFLVTNNSTKSAEEYASKCREIGFDVGTNDILCTANCAAEYLKNLHYDGKVFLIGASGMAAELKAHGIRHTPIGPDNLSGTRSQWSKMIERDPEINCVLVGFDEHFCYNKMLKASAYLNKGCQVNPDCLFVATNEDPLFPLEGDRSMPGTGTIVSAMRTLAQRDPVVIGKPSRTMFDVLVAREKANGLSSLAPEQCLMVGDRLDTDILFAKNCNMPSLAVLTGVSNLELLQDCPVNLAPDYFADSPAEFLKLLDESA